MVGPRSVKVPQGLFSKSESKIFRNAIIFLFRLLPATTLGEEIFDDEQEEFECSTSQPACKQMCYNRFSPMSHHRLWQGSFYSYYQNQDLKRGQGPNQSQETRKFKISSLELVMMTMSHF